MLSTSLIAVLLLLPVLLFALYPYRLLRNYYYARRAGMPYMVIPFDQNTPVWLVLAIPFKPFLKRWLPTLFWERLATTIYGWEYHEGSRPFEKFAKPMGDEKTMAWVTCGLFEVNSWDTAFAVDVLRRPKDFHEPEFNTIFVGRFGHNVLTTNGEHWARQRKIMAQVVNERISKVVFNETVQQTTGLLDEVLDNGKKQSAETYDAFDMMKKITIHVLSGAGMGQNVSWLGSDEKPGEGRKMTYMQSAKVVMAGVAGPIILPQWFLDGWPSFLPGHQYLNQLGHAVREYPLHTKAMLDAERERMKQPGSEASSNVVSQMIQASEGAKAGVGLTEDEMIGNLFIFTAAGFDTTANTLSYALAVLARDPQWQNWIFEEIDAILPRDTTEALDYTAVFPKATRIMALMLETLRIYTPLVHIPKSSHGEQVVRTSKGSYRLPHNTTIYINLISLHQDPAVWRDLNLPEKDKAKASSDSPDETLFRPTRWIIEENGQESLYTPPRGTYMPWSFGPRNCPGTKMAQVEFTATLLTLFRSHRIDAVPLQVPDSGADASTTREETVDEVSKRIAERIQDSVSILTLQMNNIYDVAKAGEPCAGIKLRFSKR